MPNNDMTCRNTNYVKTPLYFYNMELLELTLAEAERWSSTDGYRLHYALKACVEPRILKAISDRGWGADIVSGGELRAALDAGFPADKIIYSGVGKRDDEIIAALEAGIEYFNIESIEEARIINELAIMHGKTATVAIRVNPNVDAHTHEFLTTGRSENKFGISTNKLDLAIEVCDGLKGIKLEGLHFHIGSQITDMKPFQELCEFVNGLIEKYETRGIRFKSINLGGGLGIDYENPDENPIADFKKYFDTVRKHFRRCKDQTVHFELGRSIVAQCGTLISRVLFVKEGDTTDFVVIDAGMNDLMRPALYGAHHKIENISSKSTEQRIYDVVGPICESSDVFGQAISLQLTQRGDLIAIRSAGAYGSSMASGYNCRERAEAIFGFKG